MNMVQIPYIEHKKRMYKAFEREKRLKYLLIGTNAIWLALYALKGGGLFAGTNYNRHKKS